VRTAPKVFVTGRPGKGNGSHFCTASVAASGAAKSSGGADADGGAALTRCGGGVRAVAHGAPRWECEVSVDAQLATPATAHSCRRQPRWDQPFLRSNSARSPRFGLGMTPATGTPGGRRQPPSLASPGFRVDNWS
jgi:hypothetical protein